LAKRLRPLAVELMACSDLSRATETAQIAAAALGLAVHQDAGLREVHLGEAQSMDPAELQASMAPEHIACWHSKRRANADVRYPGGESANEVVARGQAALRRLASAHPGLARIAMVSHGQPWRPDQPPVARPGATGWALSAGAKRK
jgi:probable phosphoglycerate mutase